MTDPVPHDRKSTREEYYRRKRPKSIALLILLLALVVLFYVVTIVRIREGLRNQDSPNAPQSSWRSPDGPPIDGTADKARSFLS